MTFVSNVNVFFLHFCSIPLAGKNKAVEVETVPKIVKLLEDEEVFVRANAAGALMM